VRPGQKQLIGLLTWVLFVKFVKPKYQTIEDTQFIHLPNVLFIWQITRFAKSILPNYWSCSKVSYIFEDHSPICITRNTVIMYQRVGQSPSPQSLIPHYSRFDPNCRRRWCCAALAPTRPPTIPFPPLAPRRSHGIESTRRAGR
jgi:hypothetical protein